MSPEQAAGRARRSTARTDVYSLGCVLYEMLAGEPPFTGPEPQAILAKRLTEPAPHVGTLREIPPAVDSAVTRALARAPGDRFATAADFAAALETPTGSRRPRHRAQHRAACRRVRSSSDRLVATLLLVALARHRSRRGRRRAGPASAAVLPFVDLSPAKDQEYFSDGLTEELITSLSQVEGLRVAARTSSFQFKGGGADVREVGRQLDVGAVLEGSVRKSGNRMRIVAQLVSAEDGYQLWSESYDRELTDVFAVQEEIARAIVQALARRAGRGRGIRRCRRRRPGTSRRTTSISRADSPGTSARPRP